jgi:Flp pilus assembly protein TadG
MDASNRRRPWDSSMSSSAASSASLRSALRRFRRNRSGATVVEFALVAPVFFALLFAILETAILFFAGQVLETITQESARMIMTGQAQSAGYQQADFQAYVCKQIPALFTCNNIYIDVQSYPAFSNITNSSQIDNAGNFISNNLQYNPGGPGQIVKVTLYYHWPLIVTGLGYNISNLNGSKRLLIATAAFQNEPY